MILAKILLNRLNEHLVYQKVSIDSGRTEEHRHDVYSKVSQVKCQLSQDVDHCTTFVDFIKAFDTIIRDKLWKFMAKFGCPSWFIVPWWHTCTGPAWYRILRTVSCNKWSQARLCTDSHTAQHDVFRHAQKCFSGLWWWLSNQIPLWWQAV